MNEPVIEVGLVLGAESVAIRLDGEFSDRQGNAIAGSHQVEAVGDRMRWRGAEVGQLQWSPADVGRCTFALETTIGVQFHWQQQEVQTFAGGVRLYAGVEGCGVREGVKTLTPSPLSRRTGEGETSLVVWIAKTPPHLCPPLPRGGEVVGC